MRSLQRQRPQWFPAAMSKPRAVESGENPNPPVVRQPNLPARASIRIGWRSARFQADAKITPLGLLAIGGMVGAILLAAAPIISAAQKRR